MNLILFEPSELSPDGRVTIGGERARHLLRVLHVKPADTVRVGIIDAAIGIGTVADVDAGTVTLQCVFGAPPPRPCIDLLLALPRPKVMRRLWAQLAALGVGRIILTNAARVERHYFDTHVLSPACYRPLLIEGLQQARDTCVPSVSIHRQFRKLVEDELGTLSPATIRLVADPGATMAMAQAVAMAHGATGHPESMHRIGDRTIDESTPGVGTPNVLLALGPEGGWNEFELTLLDAHGFLRVSLGARTLRSDTACVALVAVLQEAIRGNRE
jgi:RsmE family RNA methyltransferase